MRAALYARVSTSDKDQEPETQLLPLREFVAAQGWTVAGEFVDHASANDLRGRTAWRTLLDLAAKRKIDVILCWKLDRCFRSVAHMVTAVEQFRRWGVGLRSYSEPMIDTSGTSPVGDLLMNILTSVSQFERGLIGERVRAGMDRARKQGRKIGRPGGTRADDFEARWGALRPRVLAGEVGKKQAARALGVSKSTVLRLLRAVGEAEGMEIPPAPIGRNGGAMPGVQTPVPGVPTESQ